ncbi:glutathione S-transferase-like [Plodia interpunctella]|nr:glutathione S-transferase-like [Plodia interpunctella]
MSKKLLYFSIGGIAEYIRYMLHYGGHNFEDVRFDYKKWPIKEVKDSLPYGQLPLYEEGDRKLNQSIAISRYIASQTGLLPSDPWEQAILDAAVLNVNDFRLKSYSYFIEKDETKKEQIKKEFLTDSVDFFLSRFEKELKDNNGHFGGKLSWADFYLVGMLEGINLAMNVQLEKNYPSITALMKEIPSLPGVKEYVAKRGPYVFPA